MSNVYRTAILDVPNDLGDAAGDFYSIRREFPKFIDVINSNDFGIEILQGGHVGLKFLTISPVSQYREDMSVLIRKVLTDTVPVAAEVEQIKAHFDTFVLNPDRGWFTWEGYALHDIWVFGYDHIDDEYPGPVWDTTVPWIQIIAGRGGK